MDNHDGILRIPAREIPLPASISPQAQSFIKGRPEPAEPAYPPVSDKEAWRAYITKSDTGLLPLLQARAGDLDVEFQTIVLGKSLAYDVRPQDSPKEDMKVILQFHGGAFILLGGEICRILAARTAMRYRRRVWAVDYRMPPDHPWPAAIDDGVAAYQALLDERPACDIVFLGGVAGANIAAATILRARDQGLPLPGGAILVTPDIDFTEAGDSFATSRNFEPGVSDLAPARELYANGHDQRNPYISPLFGDFTSGFPPTLLLSGTRDVFLSNAVLMHRKLRDADIRAELHIEEAGGHGGYPDFVPEGAAMTREIRSFIASITQTGHAPDMDESAR